MYITFLPFMQEATETNKCDSDDCYEKEKWTYKHMYCLYDNSQVYISKYEKIHHLSNGEREDSK